LGRTIAAGRENIVMTENIQLTFNSDIGYEALIMLSLSAFTTAARRVAAIGRPVRAGACLTTRKVMHRMDMQAVATRQQSENRRGVLQAGAAAT
jgi:hypothetical protein